MENYRKSWKISGLSMSAKQYRSKVEKLISQQIRFNISQIKQRALQDLHSWIFLYYKAFLHDMNQLVHLLNLCHGIFSKSHGKSWNFYDSKVYNPDICTFPS